jgi:CBS domain-containing protein
MKAREVMTRNVAVVNTDTPTRHVARLLLEHRISAVPVVDASGVPVGMVSEGDLVGGGASTREERRDWWLEMLAEGTTLSPAYRQFVEAADRPVHQVMSTPLVSVGEETEIGEIARLLETHHIKRVPVLRAGRIVGIVSRTDLLRVAFPAPRRAWRAG